MGKGDKKSKKGKISMGSYGVKRPRKKKTAAPAKKAPKKAAAPKKAEVSEKKETAAKPKAKKKTE